MVEFLNIFFSNKAERIFADKLNLPYKSRREVKGDSQDLVLPNEILLKS